MSNILPDSPAVLNSPGGYPMDALENPSDVELSLTNSESEDDAFADNHSSSSLPPNYEPPTLAIDVPVFEEEVTTPNELPPVPHAFKELDENDLTEISVTNLVERVADLEAQKSGVAQNLSGFLNRIDELEERVDSFPSFWFTAWIILGLYIFGVVFCIPWALTKFEIPFRWTRNPTVGYVFLYEGFSKVAFWLVLVRAEKRWFAWAEFVGLIIGFHFFVLLTLTPLSTLWGFLVFFLIIAVLRMTLSTVAIFLDNYFPLGDRVERIIQRSPSYLVRFIQKSKKAGRWTWFHLILYLLIPLASFILKSSEVLFPLVVKAFMIVIYCLCLLVVPTAIIVPLLVKSIGRMMQKILMFFLMPCRGRKRNREGPPIVRETTVNSKFHVDEMTPKSPKSFSKDEEELEKELESSVMLDAPFSAPAGRYRREEPISIDAPMTDPLRRGDFDMSMGGMEDSEDDYTSDVPDEAEESLL